MLLSCFLLSAFLLPSWQSSMLLRNVSSSIPDQAGVGSESQIRLPRECVVVSQNHQEFLQGLPELGMQELLIPPPSNPTSYWNTTHGGSNAEYGRPIVQCSDGGFAIAGGTYSFGAGGQDVWLVRTDAEGNHLWNRTFGGSNSDSCWDVVECADGGFALACRTASFGAGGFDLWLIRTNAMGAHLWDYTFGGTQGDNGHNLVECADGGFAVTGSTQSFGAGSGDMWVIRTDADGIHLWNHTYGGTDYDSGWKIITCSSGGFAVAGYTFTYSVGERDAWLVRIDEDGNHLWNQSFGGIDYDVVYGLDEIPTGGFALAGITESFGAGLRDVWVIGTDSSGNHLWNHTYGGSDNDQARRLVACSGGGFIFVGDTTSFGAGLLDAWVIRVNNTGHQLWNHTYGSTADDYGMDIVECSGGGFAFVGSTTSYGAADFDYWLVRITPVQWLEELEDQLVVVGDPFRYDVNVTADYGLDSWSIDDFENFSIDVDGIITNASFLPLGFYDVQIRVNDSNGDFLLGDFTVYVVDYIPLDAPILVSPSNGAGTSNHTPVFMWNSVSGALSYFWQLDTVVSFDSSNLREIALGLTSYSPTSQLADDTWYWRVAANDSDGHLGQFSSTWSVTVYTVFLDAPNLISPPDSLEVNTSYPTFVWSSVSGAVSYLFQLDSVSSFDSGTLMQETVVAPTYTPSSPIADGTWYWRAAANDSEGTLGYFSEIFVLTIDTTLPNWTILVYMDGDNNLEEFAFDDLNAMELVGSTEEIMVLVYVDFYDAYYAPFSHAKCFEITLGTTGLIESSELVTSLPHEPNMADWRVLRDFINFGQNYAPAEHYLLIIWDHGAGLYGLCSDDTSGDIMEINELGLALASGPIDPIDIVAFDACLMGQIEVAYQIREYAEYLVFSEAGIPVTGYPYEEILSDLVAAPNSSAETLVGIIIDKYLEAYDNGGLYYNPSITDVCLSAVKCSLIDDVAVALDRLSEVILLQEPFDIYYSILCEARCDTQGFDWADFIDLGDFVQQIAALTSNATIVGLANSLYMSVLNAINYEGHLSGVSGATGLGISLNSYEPLVLSLISDTHWDELMERFVGFGEGYSHAYSIHQPGTYLGYLNDPNDFFVFEFIPLTSGIYLFELTSLLSGYDEDFDLTLLDAGMTILEVSWTYESTESFEYLLHAGQLYYIEVSSYPGDQVEVGVGVFQLTLTQISTEFPTIPPDLLIIGIGVAIGITIIVIVVVLLLRRRKHKQSEEPRKDWTWLITGEKEET